MQAELGVMLPCCKKPRYTLVGDVSSLDLVEVSRLGRQGRAVRGCKTW